MGKKVYHIVDPETGEVVGEKPMGQIELKYCKAVSSGKLARALFHIGMSCIFVDFLLAIALFLVPNEWRWHIAMPFMVLFVLSYIAAIIYNHITDKSNKDNKDP